MKTPRFRGLQYPLRKTTAGIFSARTDVNQIRSDLLQLLLTNPGERVMMPEWGTPLDDLLFEPNDAILAGKIKQVIINSITRWEPRLVIQSIDVGRAPFQRSQLHPDDSLEETESLVYIRIGFVDPGEINKIEYLEFSKQS